MPLLLSTSEMVVAVGGHGAQFRRAMPESDDMTPVNEKAELRPFGSIGLDSGTAWGKVHSD